MADTDIDNYSEQKECMYKNEKHVVRDNGAVLRYSRDNARIRLNDNKWTYGKPNAKTGIDGERSIVLNGTEALITSCARAKKRSQQKWGLVSLHTI